VDDVALQQEPEVRAEDGYSFVKRVVKAVLDALGWELEEVEEDVMERAEMIAAIVADGRLGLSEDDMAEMTDAVVMRLYEHIDSLGMADGEEHMDEDEEMEMQETPPEVEADVEPDFQSEEPQDNDCGCQDDVAAAFIAANEAIEKAGGWEVIANLAAEATKRDSTRKADMVSNLASNDACAFTAEELEQFSVTALEKLAASLTKPDYSGMGNGQPVVDNTDKGVRPRDMVSRMRQEVG
jgi:hypothetical protein